MTTVRCIAGRTTLPPQKLDGVFRPVNLRDVIASCETGGDASRVMLAIRQRSDPKIIGYINIHNVNAVHRSADLAMRIGDERHRGHGFGKEVLAMALSYCWNHLNLERVGLVVFRHNARAIAAYSACGFKKEGVLKRFLFVDGAWTSRPMWCSDPACQWCRRSAPNERAAPGVAIGKAGLAALGFDREAS